MRRPIGLPFALLLAACTSVSAEPAAEPDRAQLVALPPVADSGPTAPTTDTATPPGRQSPGTAAVIDADRRLWFVRDGELDGGWGKYTALPALDGASAVLTVGPGMSTGQTWVTWLSLPDGGVLGETTLRGELHATATSLDGEYAAFTSTDGTTPHGAPPDGMIAEARSSSRIVVTDRSGEVVYDETLDGNFVPEAFGADTSVDGTPRRIFLLEYLPAEAPTHYRVRVLSADTGELSNPINLRDKAQTVDQQMAGYTRSQVVSADNGYLFTLYIGTVGNPDDHPHAFVHTLGLGGQFGIADGVWCLVPDPQLELEHLPGTLAVGGDWLYVASANGWVGAYHIPSIGDFTQPADMAWAVDVGLATDTAPVAIADAEGVTLAYGDRLIEVGPDGEVVSEHDAPGVVTAMSAGGDLVGDDWSTLGPFERPGWMGEVTRLYVSP